MVCDEDELLDTWQRRLDRIKNHVIREKVGVTLIKDKMRKAKLKNGLDTLGDRVLIHFEEV